MAGIPARERPGSPDEVILEIMAHGGLLRVAAMDPVSLTEVVLALPASLGREQVIAAARRRLAYVLARQHTPRR